MIARRSSTPILLVAAATFGFAEYASAQAAAPATPPATPPATAPAAAATAPDSNAAKRSSRRSWTADRREYGVGDVVTVLVDETTLASQDKNNTASESKKKDLAFGFSTATGGTKLGVTSGNTGTSQQTGASTRQNRFQTEVSVRVVAISPQGLLQIKGKKMMLVDKNQQEVYLTGWIRPQDISSTNLIDGFRVADAELKFSESGENLAAPKGGILGRILGKIWP
ncbi:MAG: flagellar basal body L-ring protein FlgH [Gemmatimonadota bacterium]|nr:flagellar basal body L-ring protein FlgH [Gemmatimonadota bacterium]